jgi:hypothetical protein
VSFAAINLCVASQRVFIVVVVYFVIDSVRKLFGTPSCVLDFFASALRPTSFLVLFNTVFIYVTCGERGIRIVPP